MFGFSIFLLGIAWMAVATLIASTLGDVWTFQLLLCAAHMFCGFIIMIVGILRTD